MCLIKENNAITLSLIIFSHTLLLTSVNIYAVDKIHFQPVSPPRTTEICLYPEDLWRGESLCLKPPQSVDLYSATQSPVDNDQIASVAVPNGMQATIYKNDNFNPPYYTLMETINGEQLRDIGMYHEISSVTMSDKKILPCDKNCIILKEFSLSLNAIFDTYWDLFEKPNKQILLNFDVNQKNDFFIDLKSNLNFILDGRKATFAALDQNKIFTFNLKNETNNISLLLQIKNNVLSVQYVEATGTEMINQSPMIDFPWPYFGAAHTQLSIFNLSSTPLALNNIVMTANTLNTRAKRGFISTLSCWGIPPLAIYNYVVQGRCNQLDTLTHKLTDFFHGSSTKVAGQSEILPLVPDNNTPPLAELAPGTQLLRSINTDINTEGLTLPAAARNCDTPLSTVIRGRYPRQPSRPCAQWVSQVLADFTLLFGYSLRTWSTDYFNTLIGNIIDHRRLSIDDETTVEYNYQPDIEQRLIHMVTTQAEDQGSQHVRTTMTQAFEYAQQNYADYLTHAVAANAQPLLFPQPAQALPLGYYELDLLSYHYQNTPVRILHNGQWMTSADHFDVEIIDGSREETQTARDAVLLAVNQWIEEYGNQVMERDGESGELTPESAIIDAGKILSHTIASGLRHYLGRGTDQFFIIRLNGQIISILLSDSIYNSDNAEIAASLTHPDFVLRPHAEGTVRGAGTAAVRAMARYMKAKGRKKITTDVLSQPSAMIKSKLGFHFSE